MNRQCLLAVFVLSAMQLIESGPLGIVPQLQPVGHWQFNDEQQGKDLSGNQNDAIVSDVTLVEGPNGEENGAYKFAGTSNSFIRIPNNGSLDTESYTIIMQLMPGTVAGPLFGWLWDEAGSEWGTHVWLNIGPGDFFFRLRRDDGLVNAVTSVNAFPLDQWSFAAATYDYATGETTSWKDGKVIGSLTYPNVRQRLLNDVLIAKSTRGGDARYWDGKVACYQFYDRALNQAEILEAQKLCTRQAVEKPKTTCEVYGNRYEIVPGSNCKRFNQYNMLHDPITLAGEQSCGEGTLFDVNICVCNHAYAVTCPQGA